MNLRDHQSVKDRRSALEQELSVSLDHIGSFSLDEAVASTRNCENMIGVAQIPMGVAGPIAVKNSKLKIQNYYVPLATTEGALVASVSRGCKAIVASGGATATAFHIGTSRGAVFAIDGIQQAASFSQFVYEQKEKINDIAQTTSKHIRLLDITVKTVGRYAFVRLSFDTQDAMGMNMVTIASEAIAAFICEKTSATCISVAGNYDIDKKPAWLNVIRGRGWEVRADVVLPAFVLKEILRTTAQSVYDVWLAKCMVGSALAGSIGFNAHFANCIAAIFLATGQDPAHVVEGSMGMTIAHVSGEDLYMSIYLPDLMIGTVGGGTGLATQKEALSIFGAKNSQEFAEIVGATVLAGEISLLSSLQEGTLVQAHKKLARGGK